MGWWNRGVYSPKEPLPEGTPPPTQSGVPPLVRDRMVTGVRYLPPPEKPAPCPICLAGYGLKKIDGEWADPGYCPDCLRFAWLAERIIEALR